MKTFMVAVVALALGTPLAAQWLTHKTPGIPRTADGKPNLAAPAPRMPDGKPDFSGLWTKFSPKYARNIAADLEPREIQAWARAVVDERRENLGKDGMQVRCLPLGPAYATSGDSTGSEIGAHRPDAAARGDAEPRFDLSPDLDGRTGAREGSESVLDGVLGGPVGR